MSHRYHYILEMAFFLHKHPVICPHPLINLPVIQSDSHCDRYCLCGCIKPIFTLGQAFGIFPAKFLHTQQPLQVTSQPLILSELSEYAEVNIGIPNGHGLSLHNNLQPGMTSNCFLSANFLSIPSFINIAVMTQFIMITFWVFMNISTVLKFYFNGTDLYTFGLQVQLLYFQASGILINAFLKRRKLQLVWNLIQEVYNDRISVMDNLSKTRVHGNFSTLRKMSYALVGITCLVGALFAIYFMHLVFRWCFFDTEAAVAEMKEGNPKINDSDLLKFQPVCPFSNGFLFLQKLSYVVLVFYNMGFAALFSGFCAILWVLYKEIESGLTKVLKTTPASADKWRRMTHATVTTTKAEQLEGLRISHGTLCRISRLLGDWFGISVLIVCVSSLLSITSAIYMGTLRLGIFNVNREESTSFSNVSRYYFLSAVHGCIAVFVLMLMLVSGQTVQNAAFKPAEIIGEASHLHLTTEERHQVSIFLQKVGTGPTGIVACNITKIGLPFLAAAATNVTTYILVILQFRLSVEPQVEAEKQQQQLHIS